jgi:lysyl-tRNA synthetase, class II
MSASEERPPPQESRGPGEPGESGRHGLDELIAERRAKRGRLEEELRGDDAGFPYAFAGVEPIDGILAAYAHLAAGEETEDAHRVAGRIAARRESGKMAFLDLVDRTGKIQLHARLDVLGADAFARIVSLDIGDLIGVDGAVLRSRRGEISLRVDRLHVLAKALRPPPDTHHGLSDIETRYRRRELDLIANADTRQLFVERARIISAVRAYLDEHGFIEVETPVLQPLYGGALARPFSTHHNELDRDLYLRIATELYLKRLIVGGLERVYELGKDFRNEGVSTKHNPEFTMVEWYEAYADYMVTADRLETLVAAAAQAVDYAGELDFSRPWRRVGYVEAIAQATGIDLSEHHSDTALAAAIAERGLELQTDGATWPQLADELLGTYVEPELQQPTLVLDVPVALSPFAREHRSKPGLAERFEAYVGGMEIANAFSEINDADVQRERFESQLRLAELGDEETQPFDELFLESLEYGMPPTSGIGVGIDRLVMALTGERSIREVVLFPAMRT